MIVLCAVETECPANALKVPENTSAIACRQKRLKAVFWPRIPAPDRAKGLRCAQSTAPLRQNSIVRPYPAQITVPAKTLLGDNFPLSVGQNGADQRGLLFGNIGTLGS